MLKFLVLFFFVGISYGAVAATGCVANSNNIMYLQKLGGNYRSNGTTATLGSGCIWIYIGGSCNVNGGIGAGLLAQDSPQNCPIDSHILILIFSATSFGYYMLRRQNILSSNET